MEKEVLEKYKRAEEISTKVIEFSKGLLKDGIKILEIAESVEKKIFELGAKPAFPLNIGINEVAAHFTPASDDTSILKVGDLVKIDIGVHVDGYICDRAFTICVGDEKHQLIEACEKTLKEALKLIKPGAKICEISEVVENSLAEFGFNPIRNLCGHGLERFVQHAAPSIPNAKNDIKDELKENQVIAMEVFGTNGSGWVKESYPALIYQFANDRLPRLLEARKILDMAKFKFEKLPFTKRWLKEFSPLKLDFALKELVNIDAIKAFPILKEQTDALVAQAEETVIL
ncbi:MAG: type II methionyl aminopeptidase [Candidatus Aenigmarchaeota archaeon]|nr:type II methionyl aminopeptidase [Candidatus Aenigmarchaeota archaeon]